MPDETAPHVAAQGEPAAGDLDLSATDCLRGSVLVGRYQVQQRLGAGGMGAVYRAVDTTLNRLVAIKVLPPRALPDPAAVNRFRREAQALARLSDPHIVQAYDAGEDRGRHFLVMEYVDGVTLARLLKDLGRVPPSQAAGYARQVALALQHAHERGLVHRDVKPSNILLGRDGQVKLADLGLARLLQDQVGAPGLTTEGAGMGTPDYMAPEQFRDAHTSDARADIYGLGCTLYHLLTGRVPFPGSSLSEKRRGHESEVPPPLEGGCPDVPAGLAQVVRRMMAKRPEDRFQTAPEVVEAMAPYAADAARVTTTWQGARFLPRKGLGRKTTRWLVFGATAAVAVAVLAVASFRGGFGGGAGEPTSIRTTSSHRLNSVAYSPDGKRIVGGGEDGIVRVWDAEKGTEVLQLKGHTSSVFCVAFGPGGKRIASASGDPGPLLPDQQPAEVRVWDADNGQEIHTFKGHIGPVYSVAFSPDGKRIVSGGGDARRSGNAGELKVWDVDKGIEVLFLDGHFAEVKSVAFSPDGKRLASLSSHHVVIWDADEGRQIKALTARSGNVGDATLTTMSFSHDGKRLVGAGHGPVYVWDVEKGEQIITLKGHTKWVRSVAYSPVGQRIASGGDDGMVRVWDVDRRTELFCLKGHTGNVRSLAYSPDGNRIVSASEDKTLRVWDAQKGTELHSLAGDRGME